MNVNDAIAAVRSGPQGPAIAAVFDFGGTVVHGYAPEFLRRRDPERDLRSTMLTSIRGARGEGEYRRFRSQMQAQWAGRAESDLLALGEKLFRKTVYGHLYPEAWHLIRAHEAAGHTLVLASCLTRYQVLPVARELGIDHVLTTAMEVRDGVLTGKVDGEPLWRGAKADAVRKFAAENGLDLTESYAYADSAVDLPLLESVGYPTAVNPDPKMAISATERNWPMVKFRPRAEPGARDIARTAATFAGAIGGSLYGIARASYTRDQRRMAFSMLSHAAGATMRISGVEVRVTGAERARAVEPAVIVFNHQSSFDLVAITVAMGGRLTCIAKQELFKAPVIGQILRFGSATFINRGSTDARAELAPVVDTLRRGTSVVVAAEGTRSITPQIGAFKKGAFHVAMQAGVPIVPIVVRNSGEIIWRNSAVVRKGVVDVAVLPPIDVSGWDPGDMDAEVERVRQLFVDTLRDWPAAEPDSTRTAS